MRSLRKLGIYVPVDLFLSRDIAFPNLISNYLQRVIVLVRSISTIRGDSGGWFFRLTIYVMQLMNRKIKSWTSSKQNYWVGNYAGKWNSTRMQDWFRKTFYYLVFGRLNEIEESLEKRRIKCTTRYLSCAYAKMYLMKLPRRTISPETVLSRQFTCWLMKYLLLAALDNCFRTSTVHYKSTKAGVPSQDIGLTNIMRFYYSCFLDSFGSSWCWFLFSFSIFTRLALY